MSKNDKGDKKFENIDAKLERIKKDLELMSQTLSLQLETESIEYNIKENKRTKWKGIIVIPLGILFGVLLNVAFEMIMSPETIAFTQITLTWVFLLTASSIIAVFLASVTLSPLGEFGVFQLLKEKKLKDFVTVSRDEVQVLAFSYFIAIVLLVPAIGFTRTSLLGEPSVIEILDIGIAAFVVFAGRAVFSYKSLVGKSFYAILSFIVIVLYITLLINHEFPSVDYLLLLPTTTTSSIVLASAGEKLLKINRVRMKIG